MSTAHNGMRNVLVALAMVVTAACHAQPQPPQQTGDPVAKEHNEMRTAVPLVRPLDPNDTAPIELEFEVAAQAHDPAPPVFIGVRLTGNDPSAVAEAAARLRTADISAEVHLFRLDPSGQTEVALVRSEWISRSEATSVALASNGLVPGLFSTSADVGSMQAAGLLAPGTEYRELAFADTPDLAAGRYRLVLTVVQHRAALADAKAELLVAYTTKSK